MKPHKLPPPPNDQDRDHQQPKAPRSEAQLQASRANGAKSQGPTSPEGKRRSSLNSITHGLTSTEHTLLMQEDPDQYREVLNSWIDNLQPATKAELRLVEKIGNLDWRIERLVLMETCLLNMEAALNSQTILAHFKFVDALGAIVTAWKQSGDLDSRLNLLRRYLGTLQHQMDSTLNTFHKLEKRRLARPMPDPAQPPYQRPVYDTLEADLDHEYELFVRPYIQEKEEQSAAPTPEPTPPPTTTPPPSPMSDAETLATWFDNLKDSSPGRPPNQNEPGNSTR